MAGAAAATLDQGPHAQCFPGRERGRWEEKEARLLLLPASLHSDHGRVLYLRPQPDGHPAAQAVCSADTPLHPPSGLPVASPDAIPTPVDPFITLALVGCCCGCQPELLPPSPALSPLATGPVHPTPVPLSAFLQGCLWAGPLCSHCPFSCPTAGRHWTDWQVCGRLSFWGQPQVPAAACLPSLIGQVFNGDP